MNWLRDSGLLGRIGVGLVRSPASSRTSVMVLMVCSPLAARSKASLTNRAEDYRALERTCYSDK